MVFDKKARILFVGALCFGLTEVNLSAKDSFKVADFYPELSYYSFIVLLSEYFDCMHEHSEDFVIYAKIVNDFARKSPKELRCQIFREALKKQSRFCRFKYSLGDQGGLFSNFSDLIECPESSYGMSIEEALVEAKEFYQYVIDSLNPRFVKNITKEDSEYQLRIITSFVNLLAYDPILFEDGAERDYSCEEEEEVERFNVDYKKTIKVVEDLYKYAQKSFAK